MDGASPEKILLIANPASRHGEGIVDAARVEALLHERADAELTVLMTQRRGHAEELAAAAGGFDLVVVVGGDGAAHEVANGLMRIPREGRPAMGVVPAGSGNDYALSLGMSRSLEEAARQLVSAPRRWVDLGVCNGRHFIETLSFGLDAAIALDTIERRKRTGAAGVTLYMQSGLPRFDTMRFPLDGFQKFDPAYQHNDFRNNRGSLGMPDQPIEYNPRRTAGFSLRTNPFSSWFYTQENTPFMQSKTPYTYLYFVNNFGQDLNFFRAIHNQNVARGLNLGVDFRVYDVYGAYTNSRSNQYNVRVTGNYITRDAKYRILFGYIHNVAAVGENGGIRTDSLFTKNMETNRLRIPVSLSDARTRWRENKYFFKQSYHFYDY